VIEGRFRRVPAGTIQRRESVFAHSIFEKARSNVVFYGQSRIILQSIIIGLY
jgi:hypothetical protein